MMHDETQPQSSSEKKDTLNVVKTDRTVTLYGNNGKAHAHMLRLSSKFAEVVSQRGAKVGTRLEIEFEIPAFGKFTVIRLLGIVTEQHISENGYHLTIKFEKIDEKSRLAIQDFSAYKQRLHQVNLRYTVPIPITE